MKFSFCFVALEFQPYFVSRPSKVRKLVRTYQFQVKSIKWVPDENLWPYSIKLPESSCSVHSISFSSSFWRLCCSWYCEVISVVNRNLFHWMSVFLKARGCKRRSLHNNRTLFIFIFIFCFTASVFQCSSFSPVCYSYFLSKLIQYVAWTSPTTGDAGRLSSHSHSGPAFNGRDHGDGCRWSSHVHHWRRRFPIATMDNGALGAPSVNACPRPGKVTSHRRPEEYWICAVWSKDTKRGGRETFGRGLTGRWTFCARSINLIAAASMASGYPGSDEPGVCGEPDASTKDFIMQQTMMRVRDPKVSLDFYTRVLGMRYMRWLLNE